MSKINKPQQLDTALWKVIGEFRGILNLSAVRDQVLCLLFIKFLSDQFSSNREKLIRSFLEQGESPEKSEQLADELGEYEKEFIPQSARWEEIRRLDPDNYLGAQLNHVAQTIEHHNPLLKGVLTYVDFCHGFEHGENRVINRCWSELIYLLDNNDFTDGNVGDFSSLFNGLLKKFADAEGRNGGEFYTPREVVSLMVHLTNPTAKMTIYDPTCGFGGTLLQAADYLEQHSLHKSDEPLMFFGQELSRSTWAICMMNLYANQQFYADIECGDTLISPRHIKDYQLNRFDRVLCHPPFGLKLTNLDAYYLDNLGRFRFGIPPKNSADLAFLQHVIASLNDTGIGTVVMPMGALCRGNGEQAIREGMLHCDLVESVIALPPGVFYGTSIPTCLVVINMNKTLERKGKVLFIDASQEFEASRQMNILTEQGIQAVVDAFDKFDSLGTFSRVISVDDVLRNDAKLNVKIYIDNSPINRDIDELLHHHEGFERVSLSDAVLVHAIEVVKSDSNITSHNSIFFRRIRPESAPILLDLKNQPKPNEYLGVTFNQEKLLSEYGKLFFESQLGRLMLRQIPTGMSIQQLGVKSIQSLNIPIPTLEVQQEVVKVAGKLEIAKKQIDLFFSKLTTEPKQYKAIEDNTDAMVYTLSSMSDAKYLQHLISLGETRQMEFKQSFFANADKIYKSEDKVEKDSAVQTEVIKDIVSFINTSGGILLIGVNDKGKVTGVDREYQRFKFLKMDNYFQELGAQLASRISPDYLQYCKLTEVPVEDKTVVRIDCSPSSHPIFMDNTKFYVRTDTSSPELTGPSMLRYIQNHFKVALFNDPETNAPTA